MDLRTRDEIRERNTRKLSFVGSSSLIYCYMYGSICNAYDHKYNCIFVLFFCPGFIIWYICFSGIFDKLDEYILQ